MTTRQNDNCQKYSDQKKFHGSQFLSSILKLTLFAKTIQILNIKNLIGNIGVYKYFLNIIEALCPPKPKVLLKAAFTERFCAELKVRFSCESISGSSVK
jgi:hypothetical protein